MKLLTTVLVTSLLTGCVSVRASVLDDRSIAPILPASVYVFLDDDDVPESCERVALLYGSGNETWTDETDMIDEMREVAGALGANAIQLQTMEDAGTGERIASALLLGAPADRDATAIALHC